MEKVAPLLFKDVIIFISLIEKDDGTQKIKGAKMARVLTLHLKKPWFDLIKRGVKLEEYREINDYWMKRLIKNGPKDGIRKGFMAVGTDQFREFDEVHFAIAYPPKKDKEKWIRIKGPIKIFVGLGRTDWGAEPGKDYFVITWNKQKL